MATSLIGPPLVASAFAAAPVPRPPQPTSATRIVLSSPAWTDGMATFASAEVAATVLVVLRNSRRDVLGFGSVIGDVSWRGRSAGWDGASRASRPHRSGGQCRGDGLHPISITDPAVASS